jgi:hypothetical protein
MEATRSLEPERARGVILEDSNGIRRTIPSGSKVKPPRRPDERIVGATPLPWQKLILKICSHCKQKGVFEYT